MYFVNVIVISRGFHLPDETNSQEHITHSRNLGVGKDEEYIPTLYLAGLKLDKNGDVNYWVTTQKGEAMEFSNLGLRLIWDKIKCDTKSIEPPIPSIQNRKDYRLLCINDMYLDLEDMTLSHDIMGVDIILQKEYDSFIKRFIMNTKTISIKNVEVLDICRYACCITYNNTYLSHHDLYTRKYSESITTTFDIDTAINIARSSMQGEEHKIRVLEELYTGRKLK